MDHDIIKQHHNFDQLSPGMRKSTMWILTRSDTNKAVQLLEMA